MTTLKARNDNGEDILAAWDKVDPEFIDAMKMKLIEGRNFTYRDADSSSVIINKTAQEEFDLKIGDYLKIWPNEYRIIGVISDFHFKSFNEKINPVILFMNSDDNYLILARYHHAQLNDAISNAHKAWSSVFTDYPMDYNFYVNTFKSIIKKELQTRHLVIFYTVVIFFIACIGLIGLMGLMAVELRQQIAIRKVLGASVKNILSLIMMRFTIITGLGLIIAVPITLKLGSVWLNNFIYKTELNIWEFIISFLVIIFLVILITTWQALNSALESPVKVIRNE